MDEKEIFEMNKDIQFRVIPQDAQEFVDWAKNRAFCNSGQHICDRLASQFEQSLEDCTIKGTLNE